jgi:DNA-binding CsgD family transcriptional regulator
MLPSYLGRYHQHDAFRTSAVERMLAARGIADLREIPMDVIAHHREYVDDFHGRFGTRTITLVKLDGRRRCGYVFVLDFDSAVPCREVRLLHMARGILARQLDGDLPAVEPGVGALSGKEKRVAELVAQGLSNAQIAAALNIKIDTVKKYLTAVYAACGVRSRTQLALAMRGG